MTSHHPKSFVFRTVPTIESSCGGVQRLGELLRAHFSACPVLVVSDSGLAGTGLLEPVLKNLAAQGFEPTFFDGVVADPPEHIAAACAARGQENNAGLIIGLGGGSSLDVAKVAALLLGSSQPLSDLYGIENASGPRLPLVLIPTTAGTGSEVTNIAILTTGDLEKKGIVTRHLYADYVLLDAELTLGLPAIHTAATGIDAMVHAIEAYTSRHKKNPISDSLAREALRLLSSHLARVCSDGRDLPAREAMLRGSLLAGQAFTNAPVAAVHALAYPLGGRHHIPHGLSNALMLSPVLRFNLSAAAPLYSELAGVVGIAEEGDTKLQASAFVDFMENLIDASGAPRRLRDVGVPEDDLPAMAAEAMNQNRLLVNNPVAVTESDALALYREAF